MKESPIRATLRRIQDIVREATGAPLTGSARTQLENVLNRHMGGPTSSGAGEDFSRRDVTILLADLRGFTSLTAQYPARVVINLLNRCFVRMSEIIFEHGGGIDKFMGDTIMAIFSRNAAAPGEDVRAALSCAVDMQIAMRQLNSSKAADLPDLYMGIGINTGRVLAGLVGSKLYSAYTLIGEDVNLASRIEAFSLRGQILVSQASYEFCQDFVEAGEPMEVYVKGKADRVRIREVRGIPSLQKAVPRQDNRRSPRVEIRLPFSYQMLRSKIVVPERFQGTIVDIGYYGVRVEVTQPTALYSEAKLDLDLPLVGHRADDIYAKVVKATEQAGRFVLGLEFSSLSPETESRVQLFVQILIQGNESR
jgi:adenylate cyclase